MSIGLLILRVVLGVLFIAHGAQKLFGAFGGGGVKGTKDMMDSLGFRRPMAYLLAVTEFGAGCLLVLGLMTPFAAAAIIGVMIVAIATVHAANGFFAKDGGFEFPMMNLTAATVLGFGGPGALSLDGLFGIVWSSLWGPGVVALGAFAAGLVLATRTPDEEVIDLVEEEEEQRAEERRAQDRGERYVESQR